MTEQWHKQQYEQALASVDYRGPAWEDLTEQQRANIRQTNLDHQKFMNDLGAAIATGGPLPDLFKKGN